MDIVDPQALCSENPNAAIICHPAVHTYTKYTSLAEARLMLPCICVSRGAGLKQNLMSQAWNPKNLAGRSSFDDLPYLKGDTRNTSDYTWLWRGPCKLLITPIGSTKVTSAHLLLLFKCRARAGTLEKLLKRCHALQVGSLWQAT